MASPLKNLRGKFYPADVCLYDRDDDVILAAASGSEGGFGKIGTLLATGLDTLYLMADCSDRAVNKIAWQISMDKAWKYQLFVARANVTKATITFADAAPVDDADTFLLNGLTFTAEATEGDADPTARKYWTGADNAAAAVNLTALLNDADYGVPGISAQVLATGAATDIITITTTDAPVLDFAQGTSDAAEIAWAETTLAKLVPQAAQSAQQAASSTTDGFLIEQDVRGWPYAYLALTNDHASDAATPVVKLIRY